MPSRGTGKASAAQADSRRSSALASIQLARNAMRQDEIATTLYRSPWGDPEARVNPIVEGG
ncbi:hypothetical protein GCG54_00015723 [Colletotrichum gloeosporioides]|uniref:Uncharacterized protein n=1 Tax=Colletotrichum gloeosporioides TaxID=474922 RepID=A0A8H4C6X3_COLGL|nr:uncharacterized protein GCG54_00015723 [Colletotrichum gloeosporioides]KAF3798400.1 hypothetical protein GCG54_00015723 [Colletotrichum gloeosporioides]